MSYVFEEQILKLTLFHAAGTNARLTPDNLARWDNELDRKYKRALDDELLNHQIPDTKTHRSNVVLLAQIGYRLGHQRQQRIRKACIYYQEIGWGNGGNNVPMLV